MTQPLSITFLGLSLTSSWGNGHGTTYRALLRALNARGHRITFLERDVPWYAEHRDLPNPDYCDAILYRSLEELFDRHRRCVEDSDVVIVGSYVPDGIAVGSWAIETARGVCGFYDIDTPVTLARLARGECEYLTPEFIAAYHLYLSFTGGPTLRRLEREFGSPAARALYCSVDPDRYAPVDREKRWDLGYLGTYSPDRQAGLERLLLEPARRLPRRRFVVAGPQYPGDLDWPPNVERIEHVAPDRHCRFYNECRFTLNLTRADMRAAGWSPSVRLFEAAACATPIISDTWPGLDELLRPGKEIILSESGEGVIEMIESLTEAERRAIGSAGRRRILADHTANHRAIELERFIAEAVKRSLATSPSSSEAASAATA